MAEITLDMMYDKWKEVADWITGVSSNMPKVNAQMIGSLLEEQLTDADVSSGVKEVESLNITAIPTVAGNVTVTLDGVATNVAIDPATDTTTDLVATKVRNANYTGWTTSGTGSNVTFTATTYGQKSTPTYSDGGTGATGTISTMTIGNAVLSFTENIVGIEIFNQDTVNDGFFVVNGISIKVPKNGVFHDNIGGTPGTNVTINGSKTFIVSRYV